jgi:hypothetical protein
MRATAARKIIYCHRRSPPCGRQHPDNLSTGSVGAALAAIATCDRRTGESPPCGRNNNPSRKPKSEERLQPRLRRVTEEPVGARHAGDSSTKTYQLAPQEPAMRAKQHSVAQTHIVGAALAAIATCDRRTCESPPCGRNDNPPCGLSALKPVNRR